MQLLISIFKTLKNGSLFFCKVVKEEKNNIYTTQRQWLYTYIFIVNSCSVPVISLNECLVSFKLTVFSIFFPHKASIVIPDIQAILYDSSNIRRLHGSSLYIHFFTNPGMSIMFPRDDPPWLVSHKISVVILLWLISLLGLPLQNEVSCSNCFDVVQFRITDENRTKWESIIVR